ncbi:hypothetical protein GGX14DRAFT_394897 [Mycena pura]|uniref:Uncharacterized protein n=1 Tax=Mycena pura TaxID=153505 RepID=A0AAD6VDT1_9AGAR|nr:hypothetical protein GGX14DRAFT_394897 [Mycena pura]
MVTSASHALCQSNGGFFCLDSLFPDVLGYQRSQRSPNGASSEALGMDTVTYTVTAVYITVPYGYSFTRNRNLSSRKWEKFEHFKTSSSSADDHATPQNFCVFTQLSKRQMRDTNVSDTPVPAQTQHARAVVLARELRQTADDRITHAGIVSIRNQFNHRKHLQQVLPSKILTVCFSIPPCSESLRGFQWIQLTLLDSETASASVLTRVGGRNRPLASDGGNHADGLNVVEPFLRRVGEMARQLTLWNHRDWIGIRTYHYYRSPNHYVTAAWPRAVLPKRAVGRYLLRTYKN